MKSSKEMYPGCRCPVGRCGIHPGATTCSLRQPSAPAAASRLTETKLPSSPAGDCEKETHKCPACGAECGCPRDENHCWHECVPMPDPLGADISGPKGSGGAAPEAECEAKYDPEYMVLVPRKPTQAMIKAAWADALDEDASGVWAAMIAEWDAQTQEAVSLHLESAAPIAPAAQDERIKGLLIRLADLTEGEARACAEVISMRLGYGRIRDIAGAERKEGEAKHG